MANYIYNPNKEAFVRENNKGKPLYVNITEAQRIVSLMDLGYSRTDVENRIILSNPKGTSTTVRSFIRNYKAGNIQMPDDAPAPSRVFDSLTDSDRLNELERRVTELENKFEEKKSWKERLGL